MKREHVLTLIGEIEAELVQLDRLKNDILETDQKKRAQTGDRRIYEGYQALQLHNFYSGCENIFKRIAIALNGGVPQSEDWHKRLLHIMSLEFQELRPAVILTELYKKLDEYLRFRHVVQNVYTFELDSNKLQALIDSFVDTYNLLMNNLHDFIDFLRSLVDESQPD